MKKQTAFIFAAIVVALALLALVILWMTDGMLDESRPKATPTPDVNIATEAPRETQFVMPTATPKPTPTPTPTPEATKTPAPERTPQPAPETPAQPSGTQVGAGAFNSSTGTGMNTHTVWTAYEQSDGSIKLAISVYARSYSVDIGSRSITVSVNGSSSSGTTRSLSVSAPDSPTDTLIYSYQTTVPVGNLSISVDWNYKGQYSGQTLDVVHSETSANVG